MKESTYYVPGLVGFGLIQAAFANLAMSVTAQRESGVLKRRRSTPEPAWVLIAGRALTAVGTAVVIAVILMLIGSVAYGATPPGRTIPAVIVTIAIGAVTFCALGYALVTAISSADSAQPVVQMVMLPLYFISGVFVPSGEIPHWLTDIANVFPVSHLQKALLEAFNPHTVGAGFAWSDLLVLVIWAAVGLAIALRRFRWQPNTR
jgi:ABC-2 type transport system permease protein